MSKIMLITQDIPYPPHKSGASSSLYNYVRCWSTMNHSIDVIYMSKRDEAAEKVLSSRFSVACKSMDSSGFGIFADVAGKSIVKPRYAWNMSTKHLNDIDASGYDIIVWGNLITILLYNKIINFSGNHVMFAADSLSLYYERGKKQHTSLLRKIYLETQYRIASKFERLAYSIVNRVFFVSEVDTKYAEKRFNGSFIENKLGVCIPPENIKEVDVSEKREKIEIGFSGIMDYEPNRKAVDFIISSIIPGLEDSGLNYRMHIIGKNPRNEWKEISRKYSGKLVVTGYVDSIEEHIARMDIYISPLFLGTGMKNKILQAMGLGVPIICSSISAEGIKGLVPGQNVEILPDENSEWVKAIIELSEDRCKRRAFSESCKMIISKEYTWERSAKNILEII